MAGRAFTFLNNKTLTPSPPNTVSCTLNINTFTISWTAPLNGRKPHHYIVSILNPSSTVIYTSSAITVPTPTVYTSGTNISSGAYTVRVQSSNIENKLSIATSISISSLATPTLTLSLVTTGSSATLTPTVDATSLANYTCTYTLYKQTASSGAFVNQGSSTPAITTKPTFSLTSGTYATPDSYYVTV